MNNKKPKEEQVTAMIMVTPGVRELLRQKVKKSERYSDYILGLIQFKEQHRLG